LAYVGKVSYFVYLAHLPIVYAMSFVPGGVVLNLMLTTGIVLGAAAVSWHWIEKPLIDRGRALNATIAGSRST
jgi:peptidoglycan/LPS O-acetylase OafA/YrhL